jgi:NAD(P)-dependent dehydrogenase (short-subunit alcohol dehydrogenase family)
MSNSSKWAVVLGVSSGTGAAVARSLSRNLECDVFGYHRGHYQKEADDLAADITSMGRKAEFHVADAGTHEAAVKGAELLEKAGGKQSVRVFVHSLANASLGRLVSGERDWMGPKQVDKTFNSMANSFVYWTQELVRRDLLAPNARLFGLTNTLSDSLVEGCALVAASKAALEVYIKQLAVELGPAGHRVNLLKFSGIVTPALKRVFGDLGATLSEKGHADLNPAGRPCTLEEVADFLCLMASPKAAWMNGATIDFTGGTTLHWVDVLYRYQASLMWGS